ncbi:hypothetical protein DFH09DRAFT_1046323 [Mycena vulgaris]|nr:hypothetical protein DFH09DRAFT_1046323 [Mycena vulgaris]
MSDSTTPNLPPAFFLSSPFDDPAGDVILRSSDGIDFHVHRLVLSLASPFFKQMFTLPQPNAEPGVPAILVSESALVLDRALRFWYPGAVPILSQTLDELQQMLECLLMKYDIQSIIPFAQHQLRGYMEGDPVSVFAIACRHEWKDLALEAAKSSLRLPIRTFKLGSGPRPHLKYITGDTYHNLLQYHSDCGEVAKSTSSSLRWLTSMDNLPGYECETSSSICSLRPDQSFANGESSEIAAWFGTYLDRLPEALATKPGAWLNSPELLPLALLEIPPGCTHCRTTGVKQLMKFAVDFNANMAKQFDLVELKLDF